MPWRKDGARPPVPANVEVCSTQPSFNVARSTNRRDVNIDTMRRTKSADVVQTVGRDVDL
jgi:hypothetical protein